MDCVTDVPSSLTSILPETEGPVLTSEKTSTTNFQVPSLSVNRNDWVSAPANLSYYEIISMHCVLKHEFRFEINIWHRISLYVNRILIFLQHIFMHYN